MTCVNCTQQAKHLFSSPGVEDQPYCDAHLPAAYRGTEWVLPAPDETLTPRSDIAADEPLAEVEHAEDDKADEPVDEDPNPLLQDEKPKSRRQRRSPGDR